MIENYYLTTSKSLNIKKNKPNDMIVYIIRVLAIYALKPLFREDICIRVIRCNDQLGRNLAHWLRSIENLYLKNFDKIHIVM